MHDFSVTRGRFCPTDRRVDDGEPVVGLGDGACVVEDEVAEPVQRPPELTGVRRSVGAARERHHDERVPGGGGRGRHQRQRDQQQQRACARQGVLVSCVLEPLKSMFGSIPCVRSCTPVKLRIHRLLSMELQCTPRDFK